MTHYKNGRRYTPAKSVGMQMLHSILNEMDNRFPLNKSFVLQKTEQVGPLYIVDYINHAGYTYTVILKWGGGSNFPIVCYSSTCRVL